VVRLEGWAPTGAAMGLGAPSVRPALGLEDTVSRIKQPLVQVQPSPISPYVFEIEALPRLFIPVKLKNQDLTILYLKQFLHERPPLWTSKKNDSAMSFTPCASNVKSRILNTFGTRLQPETGHKALCLTPYPSDPRATPKCQYLISYA